MKTNSLKAAYFLLGLLLVNAQSMNASIGDKFNEFIGSEFSSSQGLYIILGIVVASLVLYLVVNHFQKEEEHTTVRHGTHYSHHRRHHHHPHKVIKKTQ